jgi:hypothetical protein
VKKADNFDAKQWLVENKITTQSRLREINEGKQVGTLYHWTDFESLYHIIKSNSLISNQTTDFNSKRKTNSEEKCISFTRSKDKNQFLISQDSPCVLVLDGNKLSNNYKINPTHDINPHFYGDDEFDEEEYDEMEERVCGKDIKNLDKYIINIIFDEKNIKGSYQNEKEFKKVLSIVKKKNIPFEIK